MSTVTRLPGAAELSGLGDTLVEHARKVAGHFGEDLQGFMVVGYDAEGRTSVGIRIPDTMSRALATAFLVEVVRRDIVTDGEVRDQLKQAGL